MDLRRDFEILAARLRKEAARPESADLFRLFQETMIFFEKLKAAYSDATIEEKEKIGALMKDVQIFLSIEAKKLAQKVGMNEQQLAAYSANPDNFSPQQWKAVEIMKSEIDKSAAEFKQVIKGDSTISEDEEKIKEKKKVERTKKRRDRWLRS